MFPTGFVQFTCRQFSIVKLFGDATLEFSFADSINIEDRLTESRKSLSNANSGTSFWMKPQNNFTLRKLFH